MSVPMPRLHVLLSAFACVPGGGSEGGVGWTWATALAEAHDVVVLTDRSCKDGVEAELAARPRPSLEMAYVGPGKQGDRGLGVYPYYYRWQRTALRAAASLHARRPFDVVHHVTYASFRVPCHLHKLGVPLIWGPVGGGEGLPLRFADPRWIGWGEAFDEVVRWAWNREVAMDLRLHRTARAARLCAFTTAQSRAVFPQDVDAIVMSSVQLDPGELELLSRRTAGPPPPTGMRVAFAGRLLGWKGPTLALHAFADYAEEFGAARLEIYGDGPLRAPLRSLADKLGVGDKVVLHGRVDRKDLLEGYADHHAFLFPSFHDSGGFVVLEAMAAGLPVLCLDVGGPADVVPSLAGHKVAPRSPAQAARELARGLRCLTRDRSMWQTASAAARRHALDPDSTPSVFKKIETLYTAAGIV